MTKREDLARERRVNALAVGARNIVERLRDLAARLLRRRTGAKNSLDKHWAKVVHYDAIDDRRGRSVVGQRCKRWSRL
jgi:hypothetical protein